ncbi:hypothetical protein COCSUDRAFT_49329 [Coccomyxa subellipsoidea C-169]|uniref:Uncharacterized protein n=1 Tax=Coccomyxa subellipsoidea (strain C-169) TaxID=574566 RepID=I0YII8_COCSC|nr:hypothetical protein COCSUDRAFT_49329 [Coccomyxa subellipsoidea C-169]EIE18207.1 hypothetical protein COCSUDRAFT_49329 [Coccomyxa subellipsoidea C-169]|eukprot:XP_005642751.1 hypothetical protein COCSUDRAFT_49329 [Coccomyxa subellipsoidea C-169]
MMKPQDLGVVRWKIHHSTVLLLAIIGMACLRSATGARILQQSPALVDDGSSQDVVLPSDSTTKAAAPEAAAASGNSPAPVRARWASSVTQANDEGTGEPAAAPRAGLSWANQVRALPPAYQEIGAQIVSQTLGPSADIPAAANTESVMAVPEPVEDPAAAPAGAPAATDPTAAAAAPVTDPAAASTVPEATFAPTPVPTPQPTFAPTRTPAAEAGPVATALPALVPVEAPALVPAPEEGSGADTLIVGTALAPITSPAPRTASSSLQCSDSGSNNSLALSICKFITGILPAATRQQMCSRYLPKCPPAEDPPISATGLTATGDAVPPAVAAPAPAPAADTPAAATAGGTPSIFGLPIPPLGDLLGGLAQGFTGIASPTAADVSSAAPPAAPVTAVAG